MRLEVAGSKVDKTLQAWQVVDFIVSEMGPIRRF